jgi:hypothetical protein
MPTPDPKATVAAPAKPPAAPAPPVAPDDELDDTEAAPMVETVNISGLVMEKTVAPNGKCETRVIKQPMIAAEQIRATRTSQRERGH